MQFINLKQYDEVEIKKYSHFCSNLHSSQLPSHSWSLQANESIRKYCISFLKQMITCCTDYSEFCFLYLPIYPGKLSCPKIDFHVILLSYIVSHCIDYVSFNILLVMDTWNASYRIIFQVVLKGRILSSYHFNMCGCAQITSR